MLRGVLGSLRMKPARSSVSTIVNRWWADAEVFLHVGFGRRTAVQPRVQVDIGQILALLGGKNFLERLTPAIRFSWWSVPQDEEARMNVRYRVTLTQYERNELKALLNGGKSPARKLKRAQILLAADAGVSDEDIALSVGVGGSTVYRTKRRFVEGNLERALSEEPRPRRRPQAHRQGGSPAGGDCVLEPSSGPRPLDARAAGRRDDQIDRDSARPRARAVLWRAGGEAARAKRALRQVSARNTSSSPACASVASSYRLAAATAARTSGAIGSASRTFHPPRTQTRSDPPAFSK